jgi:hypothetical protein
LTASSAPPSPTTLPLRSPIIRKAFTALTIKTTTPAREIIRSILAFMPEHLQQPASK